MLKDKFMTRYFTFKHSSLPTIAEVGGKGLSLLFSNKKGFKVPSAVILSAAFFNPWMEGLKTTQEWSEFV